MEEKSKNSVDLESPKRVLTEEMKNTPLDVVGFLDERTVRFLNSRNVHTLGKLLEMNTTILFNELKSQTFSTSKFWEIRNNLMKIGLFFDDDRLKFKELGISDDVALTEIASFNISNRLKNSLIRYGTIKYLGDLLTRDYEDIIRLNNLGSDSLCELRKYVHTLGYKLNNEKPSLNEIKEEYEKNGIPMIHQELDLTDNTSALLYKNGIYTIKDLVNFGEKVFDIVGMGPIRRRKIEKAMLSANIDFEKDDVVTSEKEAAIMPTAKIVEQLKNENSEIKSRISHKEKLLSEYNRLIEERQSLITTEKKLDEEIASKMEMLQAPEQKEERINYGRR